VIAEVEQPDGTYVIEERGEPECGEDFCDSCGDCLACYDHGCPSNDWGGHRWVIYCRERWESLGIKLTDGRVK